jgi:transcriptional regulator with GAF, ATPase, and Fis domain
LREREDDVLIIANKLIEKLSRQMGRPVTPLPESASAALLAYSWPGNVRELRNVIERALITSGKGMLRLDGVLPEAAPGNAPAPVPATPTAIMDERRLRQIERDNMIAALQQTGWRVAGENGAASLIGISPSTFKSRMKALEITRPR